MDPTYYVKYQHIYWFSGHLWTDPDDVEHQIFKMFDNREETQWND